MVLENMRLVSADDADTWASVLLDGWETDNYERDEEKLSDWIWNNRTENGSYEDHPINHIGDLSEILG